MSNIKVGDIVDTSKHHQHHDLIIAWAKGAEIEFKNDASGDTWLHKNNPSWLSSCEYRIKPTAPTELDKLEARYKELGDAIKELKDKS